MEGQSGLSELSVISWVSAIQGCPLSGVPLYFHDRGVMDFDKMQIIFKAITGSSGHAFWSTALYGDDVWRWSG